MERLNAAAKRAVMASLVASPETAKAPELLLNMSAVEGWSYDMLPVEKVSLPFETLAAILNCRGAKVRLSEDCCRCQAYSSEVI